MAEVPQSTVWYFRYLNESWMKLASKQPCLSPDQIQRQLWDQWIHGIGQASGGGDATSNMTGCDAGVQLGVDLQQGDKLGAGLFSHAREGAALSRETSKHAAPEQATPSPPTNSPQPNTSIPLYHDEPETVPLRASPSFANQAKDIGVTSCIGGSPVLKHEEDQDPGFLLLLNQLAPVLERDGPMNKEQAIIMVRKKWKDMGAEEKEVWNGMAKREKKQEKQSGKGTFDSVSSLPNKDREKEVRRDMTREGKRQKTSVAREETGLVGDGKKQEAQVQRSSKPNKGMKFDTSVKVKRVTKIRKRSPASSSTLSPQINSPKAKSNNLPICNKDNTDPTRATNSSDDDESGLRHLMTHLVPKLMEGGVVNLEVAQAMVTKKWGEMGVEEKASWIQMARSRIIMEKAAEQPEMHDHQKSSPCREKPAVASDKIDSKAAVKEDPKIQSPQSPAVNEGNLKGGTSPQMSKALESSSEMNCNHIEAAAVNETKEVVERSPNEDRGATNAEAVNESANGHLLQEESRSSTMEAIASSSRHTGSKYEKTGGEGGQLRKNRAETSECGEEFQNESREAAQERFVNSKPGQKREREDVNESGSAEKKEKVEPGLIYLLANLTAEMMKRGGVQTKEEAEDLVRDKWNAMDADEKGVWSSLVQQEEIPHQV